MPFKSQKQSAYFRAVASGSIKGDGLSKETAQKFIKDTHHQKTGNLPKYANKFSRIKKAMKKS